MYWTKLVPYYQYKRKQIIMLRFILAKTEKKVKSQAFITQQDTGNIQNIWLHLE